MTGLTLMAEEEKNYVTLQILKLVAKYEEK